MTVQHNTLTGSQCHEPKGATTATSGQVYRADGAGSGSFQTPPWLTAISASTDEGVARFNGTTGAVQNSGVTIDDSNNLVVPGTISEAGDLLSATYQAVNVTKVLTADITATSTTLTDATALSTNNLAASTTYRLNHDLYFDQGTGTGSIRFAYQLVSGTLGDSGIVYTVLDPDGPDVDSSGQVAITDSYVVPAPTGANLVHVRVGGYVTVSNAAVLDLQWAQGSVAATTTLHKGSVTEFSKV